jgi:hypothetical protein
MSLYQKELLKIKTAHEAAGLTYPRPTKICDSCNEDLVLCWGNEISLYVRHKSDKSCEKTATESFLHKWAKELLVTSLNRGDSISFVTNCSRCMSEVLTLIPDEKELEFKEEVSYISPTGERSIFDVAGLDSEGKVIFGIEVFYKHRTTRITAREGIPWVEVRAENVITTLVNSVGSDFKLPSIRNISSCRDKYCIPLEDLAFKLNYAFLNRKYACEARRLVDIAIRGSYVADTVGYNSTNWSEDDPPYMRQGPEIWAAFLRRKCCLRCGGKDDNVAFGRSYCLSCYKEIRRIEDNYEKEEDRILVSDDIKRQLRVAFSWLNQVPGGWGIGSPCYFCGRNYMNFEENERYEHLWDPGSNYVDGRVWWFGDKKCCCTVCLDEQVKLRNIKIGDRTR